MRRKTKNMTLALLSGAAVCLLGGALALRPAAPAIAGASAEGLVAFVDVGATDKAKADDTALGLAQGSISATVAGEVTEGDMLFAGYAVGATYSVTATAGEYQVAVALDAAAGDTLTVNGQSVSLDGKTGKTVVSTAVTASGNFDVAATGKLCGILVAQKDSKILMAADYTAGQVVRYGALLSEELDGATGYYSDGETEELEIEYSEITASTGVNVNFTTVDVTGTVAGTDLQVTRYVTTMPDDLIYFINCGSYETPEEAFPDDLKTVDGYYSYNQTVFDYYREHGGELLNKVPDQKTTKGGDTWGIYTTHAHNAPGDATFPYNSFVWTGSSDFGTTDMGYLLTDLTAGEGYRIWIGTLSHWHGRTANITFNGEVVGDATLKINSSKGFTIFENVKADGSGKIDIHMTQIGSQNEPTINFIAVQKMTVEIEARPASVTGPSTIGMEDTTITVSGVTEGAKIQLYNAAKPYTLIFEEKVDMERVQDGNYTIDFGTPIEASQFYVAQITGGGASESPLLVSVTDIEDFGYTVSPEGYTTEFVTVTVKAHAASGIAKWSYRLGEYGEEHVFTLDRPFQIEESFRVEENGDYYVVVTSGLGVVYAPEDPIHIDRIDPNRPSIVLSPAADGFTGGSYHVAITVNSVAPVVDYALFRNGEQVGERATTAPASVSLNETGEYVVYVKTAAGLSASKSILVSDAPTTTLIKKTYASGVYSYTFADTSDYKVASVEVYKIENGAAVRQSIASGNRFEVFSSGSYVAAVTATNGTVEMFSLEITDSAIGGAPASSGVSQGLALGLGLGIGIGGVVIAAIMVITCVRRNKKKS